MDKNSEVERKFALLIAALQSEGWEPDPRGNMCRTGTQKLQDGSKIERKYRVKFQPLSVRVEVQGRERHPKWGTLAWLRVTSSYYTQIAELDNGQLRVGSLIVGKAKEVIHA